MSKFIKDDCVKVIDGTYEGAVGTVLYQFSSATACYMVDLDNGDTRWIMEEDLDWNK